MNLHFSYTFPTAFLLSFSPISNDEPNLTFLKTYEYTSDYNTISYRNKNELTKMSMYFSETSLKKYWENEDDDHWNSFL